MPVKILTVEIKVKADTPARLKDKVEMINAFGDLPAEHQQNMTKIMLNPKALQAIADNWNTLEPMFS